MGIFVGGNVSPVEMFRRWKLFVGGNVSSVEMFRRWKCRHLAKFSSLSTDEIFTDKVYIYTKGNKEMKLWFMVSEFHVYIYIHIYIYIYTCIYIHISTYIYIYHFIINKKKRVGNTVRLCIDLFMKNM